MPYTIALFISCSLWLSVGLSRSVLAQDNSLFALPVLTPASSQDESFIPEAFSAETLSSVSVATDTVLTVTLPDVITLLLQNNRDLKNAALARIVQQQELRQAESVFEPDFQPTLTLGLSDTLTTNQAEIVHGTALRGDFRSSLGTNLSLTLNLLDDQDIGLTLTQPLFRGFGTAVNTAPVEIARLRETGNELALQQQLITRITSGIVAYYDVVRAQAALNIQQLSLMTQQQQRTSIAALVEAGRRARFELVQFDANIAVTETDVLQAQNILEQTQSDLLMVLDLDTAVQIRVSDGAIDELRQVDLGETLPPLAELLTVAYANRTDYLQAQLDQQVADLNAVVTADNRRWNLDLRANASAGTVSNVNTALVLTRVLEDESTETAFRRSQVEQVQLQNTLENLTADIRLEVADRLRDIESTRSRIEATRLARELAEQRLESARELARRGRGRDIFELLELQNAVVSAQNNEANAAIDLVVAIATLNQSLGLTLTVWSEFVEASNLLIVPSLETP